MEKEDEMENEIYNKMEKDQEYTTYGIAKLTGYSQTSVSIKLPRLQAQGKVTMRKESDKGGIGFKYIWKKVIK